jgi:hypothetical protein
MPIAATGSTERSQPKLRVFFLGLAAILTFFGAVGLVLYLQPGGDSPAPAIFVAGPVEAFEPGTVTYFQDDHVFIVRLTDGALLALYDLGSRMQADIARGETERLKCRAREAKLPQALVEQPGLALPPGFENAGFNQLCDGGDWDATGKAIWGPLNGDLDRFPVGVVDGVVQVDLANRRCMNPVSELAPCLPTQ